MDARTRVCIINASTGNGWYPMGSLRLQRSLIYHGYAHDMLFWNAWPNYEFDLKCPYNVKAAAFVEALKLNYDVILWLDSSAWAVNNPYLLLDKIVQDGYFFNRIIYPGFSTYLKCSQTCSDSCLEYFNVTRDEADSYYDILTGCFGIHTHNQQAMEFIKEWINAARNGQFSGSRDHANQSSDPRFLFHRQDQSCASIIANKMGLKITEGSDALVYYTQNMPASAVFAFRGL